MRFYSSLKSIPELSNVPADARPRLWKLAFARTHFFKQTDNWVYVAAIYTIFPGSWLLIAHLQRWHERAWVESCAVGEFIVALYLVVNRAVEQTRPHLRPLVRAEFGQLHCWDCGYDLRETISGVCPECGAAVNGTD